MSTSYYEDIRGIFHGPAPTTKTVKPELNGGGGDVLFQCQPSADNSGAMSCKILRQDPQENRSIDWLALFRTYKNSGVQVMAESVQVSPLNPYENPRPFQARGSAFFISPQHLLTNSHVVSKSLQCFLRRESEGERQISAKVRSICPMKDLALLEIKPKEISKLRSPIVPMLFGDSDELAIPGEVAAFGFQLGMPDIKMTIGNLTGHHRETDNQVLEKRTPSFLHISTPINPGSSGGNLTSHAGKVVGVVAAGIPGANAYGYGIPTKVVFSILRNLFHSEVYENRIVPTPILPFEWQSTNRTLLMVQNVDTKYGGGLYITKRRNEQMRYEHDIQPEDVIVEIRCVNPYTPEKGYLNVATYQNADFFPPSSSSSSSSSSLSEKKTPLATLLLDDHEKDTVVLQVQERAETPAEEQYLSGGLRWNLREDQTFPAFKILFQEGDETIRILEKTSSSDTWKPSPLYATRKMFVTDFLDMIPSGFPLLFIVYRYGKRICVQRNFSPILPRFEGLRPFLSPFEDYRTQYEVLSGLVLVNLDFNHFKLCLPSMVERLKEPKRFEPAVIVTQILNLSEVARLGIMEPLTILEQIELHGPILTSHKNRIQYQKIASTQSLHTIQDVRAGLWSLVQQGTLYLTEKILPQWTTVFQPYLNQQSLHRKTQRWAEAGESPEEISRLLSATYSAPYSNQLDHYLPYVKGNPKSWRKLLSLCLKFQEGISLYVDFPYIFMHDAAVQQQLQISITPFAETIYTKLRDELVPQFEPSVPLDSRKSAHRPLSR